MKKLRSLLKSLFLSGKGVGIGILLTALAAGLGLTSCNVTRTVTTRSEAWQRGDTSVVIQTKTVESYDGSRKY